MIIFFNYFVNSLSAFYFDQVHLETSGLENSSVERHHHLPNMKMVYLIPCFISLISCDRWKFYNFFVSFFKNTSLYIFRHFHIVRCLITSCKIICFYELLTDKLCNFFYLLPYPVTMFYSIYADQTRPCHEGWPEDLCSCICCRVKNIEEI